MKIRKAKGVNGGSRNSHKLGGAAGGEGRVRRLPREGVIPEGPGVSGVRRGLSA